MRVLFAVNYVNSSKQIYKLYKKNYKKSLDIDVADNKIDAFKFLKENKYEVLIINTTLDGQAILFSEIEYIFNENDQRIILLIDDNKKNTDYPQMLYNLGLYDGIYESDSTNLYISELINKARNAEEAKDYYNASDEVNLLQQSDDELIDTTELLILIEKMKSLNSLNLVQFLSKLEDIYSKDQLIFLLKKTDLDIRTKLIDSEVYKNLLDVNFTNEVNDKTNISKEFLELETNDETQNDLTDNNDNCIELKDNSTASFLKDENFEAVDELDDLEDLDFDNLYISPVENKTDKENISDTTLDEMAISYEENSCEVIEAKQPEIISKQDKDIVNRQDVEPKIVERIIEVEKVIEKIVEVEKVVEIEKIIEVEKVIEKVVEVDKTIFNRVIIGAVGVKNGVGTTYNSISLAKYLSKNYKVAVVEFKRDFIDIAEAYEVQVKDNKFTLEGLDYFSINIDEFYKKVLNSDYQYIVVDFGVYDSEIIKDFYRTDIKLVLCGTQIWEDKYLSKFLTDQQAVKGVKYLFNMSKFRQDIVDNMPGLEVIFINYFEDINTISPTYQSILQEYTVGPNNSNSKKKSLISSFLRRD